MTKKKLARLFLQAKQLKMFQRVVSDKQISQAANRNAICPPESAEKHPTTRAAKEKLSISPNCKRLPITHPASKRAVGNVRISAGR